MALAVEVSRGGLADSDLERISAVSGQNPFLVVEMASEVLAGRLEIAGDGLLPELPPSMRQLLDARVSCLDELAVYVLQLLCVIDRPTQFAQLGALVSVDTISLADLASVLEPLTDLRLVKMDGGVVQVRHALLRQAVYESLSSPRRAALHLQVARFYSDAQEERSIDQAALHYHRAHATEQAFGPRLKLPVELKPRGPLQNRFDSWKSHETT
jgi:hypothetical protein